MNSIFTKMNQFGASKTPFLFLFDFEMEKPLIYTLDKIPKSIEYKINNKKGTSQQPSIDVPFEMKISPVSFDIFSTSFDSVLDEINFGNSFLLNLTFPSKIKMNYSLEDVFHSSKSKYKFLLKDKFVSFSPETFIKIKDDSIFSYPMKGTIDASLPNAKEIILSDPKETAEHYTIVDLIRNDLARISTQVEVTNFRYIDEVKTHNKTLLQVSSEIKGQLNSNWHENIGDIFKELLPAGSISGAPKKKTLEVIQQNEIDKRGYYTGIAGIYDGHSVDSCVLIRFIEKCEENYCFRSGGGITFQSKLNDEYQELIQKIYVPIF